MADQSKKLYPGGNNPLPITITAEALAWLIDERHVADSMPLTLPQLQAALTVIGEGAESTPEQQQVEQEVRRYLKLPDDYSVTWHEVNRAFMEVVYRFSDVITQEVQREESATPRACSMDHCAAHILALCPVDFEERMSIARETWVMNGEQIPDAEIIASILCAHRNELHAGDMTEVQPRPLMVDRPHTAVHVDKREVVPTQCPAEEVLTHMDAQLGEFRMRVLLCGKLFVPKRYGQKFGCQACGDAVYAAQRYMLEVIEARKRNQPWEQVPKPRAFQVEECTCGRDTTQDLLVPSGRPVEELTL